MPAAQRATACVWALVLLSASRPGLALGQEPAPAPRDTVLLAGDADTEEKPRKIAKGKWNEFDFGFTTFRFGAGFLIDYMTFKQDQASGNQVSMDAGFKVRDFRLLFRGRFNTKRPITWQTGFMYDGTSDTWFVRQTGLMIAVPEIWGHFWIGRAKEGFSLSKVMVGYDGFAQERQTFTDATVPLLADGIKWLGYIPSKRLLWNIGVFTDWLSEGQSFSSYDHQFVARVAWVPIISDTGTLLHIAGNFRTGKANNGQMRLRSKPEANLAPYFIDTGVFDAQTASTMGVEAYYRPGPWLFALEYYVQTVNAPASGDPIVNGGEVLAAWLVTGDVRSYNGAGGYFRAVSPTRTVFEGGPGAWEAVLRLSYSNLNDGTIVGGKFWRITPVVNWHLSDNARLELTYGYGKLDRFDTVGTTHFFQSRLQLQF